MNEIKKKKLDLVVIGSGLSALNFIDTYLDKYKKIHVISPANIKEKNILKNTIKRILPAQMKSEEGDVEKYFKYNNFNVNKKCKAIGVLNRGGLSNYWGLQMDSVFYNDQKRLKKKIFAEINKNFVFFLKKYHLVGQFKINNKIVYNNDFNIPVFLKELIYLNSNNFECEKPILAFIAKNLKKKNINDIKEINSKFTAKNFIKKIKKKGSIVFHNFYVKKIKKTNNQIEILCSNNQKEEIFLANKVIFASGTITTTKIIIDFLKIKKEIKIKHHQRLLSVYLGRNSINSNLKFTPSLLQIKDKSKRYAADLRPGNKMITDSIIDAYPFFKPIKFFLNLIKNRMIFSNILLNSQFSNIYMKKTGIFTQIYSKKSKVEKLLVNKNYKVFKFLFNSKIIFPFYKTLYPGPGADYHYFGTIPFHQKGKLSVNENCQLKNYKNIYIVDGSIFNFKRNKYPLGLIIANARRIGKLL